MFKIGSIEISSRVVLGPMAGITSEAYRLFCKPFGVGLSFTEMISDYGIMYENEKTEAYLPTLKSDRPVALQLFGSNIETTQKAIEKIQKLNISYDFLDLNFGCPVPKVTKSGAGSAWLKEPQKLFEYVKEIVKISTKPVLAKIRLGWDDKQINFFEVASLLERAGVVALTIHARTTKQMYSGKVDWNVLKGLKEKINIPLIVSGDIFTLNDAKQALAITNADAVMVARGGVGNPNLIRQINTYLAKEQEVPPSTLEDQITHLRQFSQLLIQEKGERKAIMILRGLAPKFFVGLPNAKQIKKQLTTTIVTYEDLNNILKQI